MDNLLFFCSFTSILLLFDIGEIMPVSINPKFLESEATRVRYFSLLVCALVLDKGEANRLSSFVALSGFLDKIEPLLCFAADAFDDTLESFDRLEHNLVFFQPSWKH